jgi:hypothetical protein
MVRFVAVAALSACVSGCVSEESGGFSADPLQLPDDGLDEESCHPFRTEGACGVPYPSSFWLEEDESTETGYRVALAPEIVAASAASDEPFDPTLWNVRDGFSPASPIVAYFSEKLDDTSLPSQHDYESSLDPASATLIVNLDTGELVPHFAELDLSADITPEERQPLMLRPAAHLQPNTHYGVAITKSLATLEGGTPERPIGFASALAGGYSKNPKLEGQVFAAGEVIAALGELDVSEDDLLLAWDFRTASANQATKHVLSMRDQALAEIGDAGMGFTIATVEQAPNAEIFKRVRGTFTVPSFLTSDDRTIAETELVTDDTDTPVKQANAEYPFELVIPASADTSGPYPLLVYGHGLLGGADQVSSGHVRTFCNDKGYVCIGTDFIGLSAQEEAGIGQNGAAIAAVQDVNKMKWVAHRLQQAMVNFMALTRVAKSIVVDSEVLLTNGASALVDPFEVYYYGISQGGIMGASLMAYSPDIERGVLQVGGSAYSLMIQRSSNWNQFFPAIRNAYPDRVDQQLIMALWQPLFDDSEGSGTAFFQGGNDPLPGTGPKHVLLQIAVGDSQVANLAAEIQARTMGIPLLVPSAKDVQLLEPSEGDAENAIAFWDLVREPPPETNATPVEDNEVHGDIRKHPLNQEQTDTFLRTGLAQNPCGGPCSFPGFDQ